MSWHPLTSKGVAHEPFHLRAHSPDVLRMPTTQGEDSGLLVRVGQYEDENEGEGADVKERVHENAAHAQVERVSVEGAADTRGTDGLRRTDGDPPA